MGLISEVSALTIGNVIPESHRSMIDSGLGLNCKAVCQVHMESDWVSWSVQARIRCLELLGVKWPSIQESRSVN